jgi:hypothetical protein
MKVVLDAGALVAIDRRDRKIGALLAGLHARRVPFHTSAGVVAQVWRDGRRQALLARALGGVRVVGLGSGDARTIGELLGRSGTTDVVDAHVALLVEDGDRLLTSDVDDLSRLLAATGKVAQVIAV